MSITEENVEQWEAYYKQLVHATIIETYLEEMDGRYLPHVVVRYPNGTTADLEVCRTLDGDGYGHLFGV